MAKSYLKGDDYRLYLNTGSYGTPTWTRVKAVNDLAVDFAPSDIVVPEQGISDGHLQGYGDPSITFTLFEDTGDTSVTAIVTAMLAGTMKEIAVSGGDIATTGTKYYRLESCFTGVAHKQSRGEPSQWDVEAKRHANSDNEFTRATAA
jgi:hypothetical protein